MTADPKCQHGFGPRDCMLEECPNYVWAAATGEGFAFFTWYRLTRPTKPWLANPKSELFFWRRGAL